MNFFFNAYNKCKNQFKLLYDLLTSSTIPRPNGPKCSWISGVVDSLEVVVLEAKSLLKAVLGVFLLYERVSKEIPTSDSGSNVNNSWKRWIKKVCIHWFLYPLIYWSYVLDLSLWRIIEIFVATVCMKSHVFLAGAGRNKQLIWYCFSLQHNVSYKQAWKTEV